MERYRRASQCGAGRLRLGVSAGYAADEFAAFGVARRERGPRMEEGLEIIRRVWTEDVVTLAKPGVFEGRSSLGTLASRLRFRFDFGPRLLATLRSSYPVACVATSGSNPSIPSAF